jgi:hypothetical protein
MSKKNLLNESTVRQFMKFANLGGLSENFINEKYMDEEEHAEGVHAEGEHEDNKQVDEIAPLAAMAGKAALGGLASHAAGKLMGEEEPEIAPMDDDLPGDDLPGDDLAGDEPAGEELPPEAVSALERAVEAAADAMLDALAPFGVEGEASVEGDEAPDLDLGADDEAPAPVVGDDEGDILDEVDMIDEDEVVNETMTRVMNRLSLMKEAKVAEAKKDKMIDSVADAIIARLRAKK